MVGYRFNCLWFVSFFYSAGVFGKEPDSGWSISRRLFPLLFAFYLLKTACRPRLGLWGFNFRAGRWYFFPAGTAPAVINFTFVAADQEKEGGGLRLVGASCQCVYDDVSLQIYLGQANYFTHCPISLAVVVLCCHAGGFFDRGSKKQVGGSLNFVNHGFKLELFPACRVYGQQCALLHW